MINAKDILQLVRYKLKDNNELLFSDYDIKNCLNEALRYIGQSQALQNSDFLQAFYLYNEDEINALIDEENKLILDESMKKPFINIRLDGAELPKDYVILTGVNRKRDGYSMRPCDANNNPSEAEYKVVGNRIYSGSRYFVMGYKRSLEGITSLESGIIDLPIFCTDLIVKVTCMILNQAETDILLKTIDDTARAIVPRRRYNNAETKMPFIV